MSARNPPNLNVVVAVVVVVVDVIIINIVKYYVLK